MKQIMLRDVISVFLVASQVAVPAVIFLVFAMDGLTGGELKQLQQIVVPMVAALGGLGIKPIIGTRKRDGGQGQEPELSRLFVGLAMGLPTLFVLVITGLVLLKAWNLGLRSFEDLKTALAAVQTVFGVATGQIMAALFGKEKGQ